MLEKQLKSDQWWHVVKAMQVLEFCLIKGSTLVVTWSRKNHGLIKSLRNREFVDVQGRDLGYEGTCLSRSLLMLID
jgi:epsin